MQAPPLLREHRLYQADWLLRFYGFEVDEIAPAPQKTGSTMLDLDIDPKLAWALRHPERFRRLIIVGTGGLDTPHGHVDLGRVGGLEGEERRAAIRRNLLGLMLHHPDTAHALSEHGRSTILSRHTCAHRVDELMEIVAAI